MQVVSARVTEPVGFHARPAAVAVTQAGRFKCSVELRYKDQTADMKSIIQIMKMGIPWDAQIEICCAGEDEKEAAELIGRTMREKGLIE